MKKIKVKEIEMKEPLLAKKTPDYLTISPDTLHPARRDIGSDKIKLHLDLDLQALKDQKDDPQHVLATTCLEYYHQVVSQLEDQKSARANLLAALRELNAKRPFISIFSNPGPVVNVPVRTGAMTLAELIIVALSYDPEYSQGGFDPILRALFNLNHGLNFTVVIKNLLPLDMMYSMLRNVHEITPTTCVQHIR